MVGFFVSYIIFYLTVAVHRSSAYSGRINKRYYDTWESNNDGNNNGGGDLGKPIPSRQKGSNKNDPCENKPLWFLKSQARLGKLSPFYDCLTDYGLERK